MLIGVCGILSSDRIVAEGHTPDPDPAKSCPVSIKPATFSHLLAVF